MLSHQALRDVFVDPVSESDWSVVGNIAAATRVGGLPL